MDESMLEWLSRLCVFRPQREFQKRFEPRNARKKRLVATPPGVGDTVRKHSPEAIYSAIGNTSTTKLSRACFTILLKAAKATARHKIRRKCRPPGHENQTQDS